MAPATYASNTPRKSLWERSSSYIYIYVYGIKYVLVYMHISFSTYFHAKAHGGGNINAF